MKKLLIILDPAHGEETPGKRSPDGQHREYKWSRERIAALIPRLQKLGYQVELTNTTTLEVGLSNRKNTASEIARRNPSLVPFLISIHNDAMTADGSWQNKATGISVFTSKGRTTSDILADYFIQNIGNFIPEVKVRLNSQPYLEKDFEQNFTVLMGAYSAILIECMFQDNKDDVAKLADPTFCKQVEDWIVDSIEKCNEYVSKKTEINRGWRKPITE